MINKDLLIIVYNIIVVLSVMYATQPLQPLLSNEFNITIVEASQFTAVIMLFLAMAPIIYGYLLERVDAKKILIISSYVLVFTNTTLAFSNSYEMFLIFRTMEAVVIPAILTSCMSILANMNKDEIKLNMSIYVASTVFGGLIGRIISGYIASYLGWEMVFISLSVASILGIYLISKIEFNTKANLTKATLKDIKAILHDKRFTVIYIMMFCVFFVFAGLLNILPFRIKDLDPSTQESQIGLLYLGYGVGILVSLFIHKIVKFFQKELRTILVGIVIFFISTGLYLIASPLMTFLNVFLFCLGMFIVHTVSTRIANTLKEKQKSLTSGMYLTFYYIGGALGSIIPSFIYDGYGWNKTIYMFMFLLALAFSIILFNKKLFKDYS